MSQLETTEAFATFTCEGLATCCAFSDPLEMIVGGVAGGHVHFLHLRSRNVEVQQILPSLLAVTGFCEIDPHLSLVFTNDLPAFLDQGHALLHGHSNAVNGVAFSPDGKRLATASEDGNVQVYALEVRELLNLARSRVTRAFTAEECQRYFQPETCPPLP